MIAVRLLLTAAHSRASRVLAVLLLVVGMLATSAVPAGAVPTVAEDSDTAAVAAWPADLQQLVNGTQAFTTAPWFTQGPCKDRGGDVAEYINTFFQREAAFRREVIRDIQQKTPQLIDENTIAEAGADDAVFPNGNAAYNMPADTCADDLKAWTTADDSSPWGFTWVSRPDPTSFRKIQEQALAQPGDPGDVLDPVSPTMVCAGDNQKSYLCSRAFWVNCEVAPAADQTRCLAWNTAVQRHLNGMNHWIQQNISLGDRIAQFFTAVGGVALWLAGGWVIAALGFLIHKLGDAVDWAAEKGMSQVVAFATAGAVWLWGKVIGFLIDQFTPNLIGGGFVDLYNLISGIMMGLAFLIWLAGLTMAWKRGRLAGSIAGAVKAVVGIQIVGAIAWMMLELANQATKALIAAYANKVAASQFALSLSQLYPPIAFITAILLIFALIGTAIVLAFQAPAVIGHALFGTVAAAGQANQATSHWLQKWFIRLLSLAWCKFFMVGMTLLAINLVLPTGQNAAQNFGQQFFGVLLGLALMIMLPTTPWLLSGLMSFTVGHASRISDSIAMGMTEKLGKAAMSAAAGAAGGGAGAAGAEAGAAGGSGAGVAGGASKPALSTMANNLASLDSAGANGKSNASGDDQDGQDGQTAGDEGTAEPTGVQAGAGSAQGTGLAGAAAAARSGGDGAQNAGKAGGTTGGGTSSGSGGQPGTGQGSTTGQAGGGQSGSAAGTAAAAAGAAPGARGAAAGAAGETSGGPLDAARGRGTPGVAPGGGEESSAASSSEDGADDAVTSPDGTAPSAGTGPVPSGVGTGAGRAATTPGAGLAAAAAASSTAGGTAAGAGAGAAAASAAGAGPGGAGPAATRAGGTTPRGSAGSSTSTTGGATPETPAAPASGGTGNAAAPSGPSGGPAASGGSAAAPPASGVPTAAVPTGPTEPDPGATDAGTASTAGPQASPEASPRPATTPDPKSSPSTGRRPRPRTRSPRLA